MENHGREALQRAHAIPECHGMMRQLCINHYNDRTSTKIEIIKLEANLARHFTPAPPFYGEMTTENLYGLKEHLKYVDSQITTLSSLFTLYDSTKEYDRTLILRLTNGNAYDY